MPKKENCKEEWQRVEDMFELFDEDRSGQLDADELGKLMRSLGYNITDDNLNKLIAEFDPESSGNLDFSQFVSVMAKYKATHDPVERRRANARKGEPIPKQKGLTETEVLRYRDMYDLYDTGRTGFMGAMSLTRCMRAIGYNPTTTEVDKMLTEFDSNRNKEVDFQSFLALIAKYKKTRGPPEKRRVAKGNKKAVSVSKELTSEEITEYREMFDLFDEDRSGAIDADELGKVMRALGLFPTNAEVLKIVEETDEDGSGVIEFSEFLLVMVKYRKTHEPEEDPDAELLRAFKVFDKDGSGYITADELRDFLTRMGEPLTDEEVDDLLRQADLDGDGQISYEEFVKSGVLS
eukprot:TRINITY_DN25811_c0_g1_i1.p1 TRINITY_DN25811_c0_g1~~TRINITY_DN25811_c0_g1_i1.p1  ORF type:complete len:381 (+),score=112.29 TRINITY_DN25811_c0_g1_i1:97-1143(+)